MALETHGVSQLELEAVIGFNGKFSCKPNGSKLITVV